MAHGNLIKLRKAKGKAAVHLLFVLHHLIVFPAGIPGGLSHIVQTLFDFIVHVSSRKAIRYLIL